MFFDKPVWKLSLAQQATLAGLPQSPTDYNPLYRPDLAIVRRDEVLQAMVQSHYISVQQAIRAERSPLHAKNSALYTQRQEPYIFDYALSQLIQHYGLKTVENEGLKVYTTIDPKMQQLARSAIVAHQPGGSVLDDQPAAGAGDHRPVKRAHRRARLLGDATGRRTSTIPCRPIASPARRSRCSR